MIWNLCTLHSTHPIYSQNNHIITPIIRQFLFSLPQLFAIYPQANNRPVLLRTTRATVEHMPQNKQLAGS
ncbi:unnamed protein product [Meloidogyne enterolobii]|uniref:Uncharacterized protein n=1 Tax=Meloidogyne enterolobii TaxID=390850 RepID=A0ACB0YDB6_MELEN